MIVSSNLPFSGWGETFGNATAATAIIDRHVVEKCAPSSGRISYGFRWFCSLLPLG
jgi:DNA replication protein DnaC